MNVLLLHARVRVEEKLLHAELTRRGHGTTMLAVDDLVLSLPPRDGDLDVRPFDVVFDRCLSHSKAQAALALLEGRGARCVNRAEVARVCGDKIATNVALVNADVPVPAATCAFSREAGVTAIERLGYPAVLKPPVGSWGRLLAKLNDRDATEAVLEHKETLGGPHHGIVYAQQYVEKDGRDIRAFVVDDDVICAIERRSPHWITNTARGARASGLTVGPALERISRAAARAVGGGIVAVDVFEAADGALLVGEVNATMEFRNSIETTGVDIPARIVDALERAAGADEVGAPARAREVGHA